MPVWLSRGLCRSWCWRNILQCMKGHGGCWSSSHQSTTNTVWNSVKVQLIMQERMCPGKTCLAMPSRLLGCLTALDFSHISQYDFRAKHTVWFGFGWKIKDPKANCHFLYITLPKTMHKCSFAIFLILGINTSNWVGLGFEIIYIIVLFITILLITYAFPFYS